MWSNDTGDANIDGGSKQMFKMILNGHDKIGGLL